MSKQGRAKCLWRRVMGLLLLSGGLSACQRDSGLEPTYGAETPFGAIAENLSSARKGLHPARIKQGEFVHFAETQEIAGGASRSVVAETGQTVTERRDAGSHYVFTIVEHRIVYKSDNTYNKVSREFKDEIRKPDNAHLGWLALNPWSFRVKPMQLGLPAELMPMTESGPRISYHNLKTKIETVPPPERVRRRQNCSGLPNCQLEKHRITFTQVTWDTPKGTPVHFEFVLSPSVPYLASVLDKCVSLLVPVGESGSKVLVRQCSPVLDFRFDSN